MPPGKRYALRQRRGHFDRQRVPSVDAAGQALRVRAVVPASDAAGQLLRAGAFALLPAVDAAEQSLRGYLALYAVMALMSRPPTAGKRCTTHANNVEALIVMLPVVDAASQRGLFARNCNDRLRSRLSMSSGSRCAHRRPSGPLASRTHDRRMVVPAVDAPGSRRGRRIPIHICPGRAWPPGGRCAMCEFNVHQSAYLAVPTGNCVGQQSHGARWWWPCPGC